MTERIKSKCINRSYNVLFILLILAILITGCSSGEEPYKDSPSPSTPQPSLTPQLVLDIVYPLPSTELIGGQVVRVTLVITDQDNRGITGANPQVDLLAPNGSLFTSLEAADQGDSRYLTNAVNLPLRNAAGTWTIQARADLVDDQGIKTNGSFQVRRSFSEGLEELYGFWIDLPTPPFAYTGPSPKDPKLKFHPYQGGGGVVILTNLPISGSVAEFLMLDIHWRPIPFPMDQAAALTYINDLAGPHTMTVSYINLEAKESIFLDRSSWLVSGYWVEPLNSGNHPNPENYPAEWIVFNCPESDLTWTLFITSRNPSNMPELRGILDTFQCPAVN